MRRAECIFLSHGGGPMPLLEDASHEKMVSFFKKLSKGLGRPEAIVVISAHWEASVPTLIDSAHPGLLYDYFGFPKETYALSYPLKTALPLLERIKTLFLNQEVNFETSSDRGFDHGVFIPLMLMFQEGDIPVVQLSLLKSLNPTDHIELGKALEALMEEPILIIGSGFSFHNLRAFQMNEVATPDHMNDAFHDKLIQIMCSDIPESVRTEQLIHWDKMPHARYCHPREEHLLPLHVVYGILGEKAEVIFDDYIAGKRSVMFYWGCGNLSSNLY